MKFFSDKTVLVTGATGLIGSNLIDALLQDPSVKVIALSHSENKLQEAFGRYKNNKNFSYIAQDICEPLRLNRQVDFIFHAAGPMERNIVLNYPLNVIFPNITGTQNCFNFMLRQKQQTNASCRLILFSSITVYANPASEDKTVREGETGCTEALDSPKASYSQSKRLAEVLARAYQKQLGCDCVIARLSTVYGCPRFMPNTAFFEFINNALNGKDIHIQTANAPKRDNIYVDDAVKGLLLIAEKGQSGEAYNISSNGELGNYAAIDEIAKEIAAAVNEDSLSPRAQVLLGDKNGQRMPGLKLDNQKLKNLGWNLSVSLPDGIRKTISNIKKRNTAADAHI